MGLAFLLQWYNLVYLIPFGMALLLLMLQLTGLGDGHHEVGGDAHVALPHDAHPELGHHDLAHSHDLGSGGPGGHDGQDAGHPPGDHSPGLAMRAISVLGLGRIPLSLALMTFCFTFGFFGYALNVLLAPLLGSPALFFPCSLAGSLAASLAATASFAHTVANWLPKVSTHGSAKQDIVGRVGEVLYALDAEGRGTLRVRDRHGNLLQFEAYAAPALRLPAGAQVLVVRHDPAREAFEVEPCPDEIKPLPPGGGA